MWQAHLKFGEHMLFAAHTDLRMVQMQNPSGNIQTQSQTGFVLAPGGIGFIEPVSYTHLTLPTILRV